jgi:sugar/nucleoside kinase (ribokinase family)
MIVVIGALDLGGSVEEPVAAGLAGRAARAAAGAGASVEVVSKVGDGPDGDAVLLALARAGVGHVATLRDATHPTPRVGVDEVGDVVDDPTTGEGASAGAGPELEAADVALALRYLTDYRAILVLEPTEPGIVREAAAAAGWAGAHLIVAGTASAAADGEDLPTDALLLALDSSEMASGTDDGDEGLVPLLGRYAAAVASGTAPADAFAAMTAAASRADGAGASD